MYTVYKITNTLNNKYYIGVHKTNNLEDGYMGSGVAIRNAISKHGRENFTKEILLITEDKQTAYSLERELTVDFIKESTYNMKLGGVGGWSPEAAKNGSLMCTQEHRSKGGQISSSKKLGIHSLSSDEKKAAGQLGGFANKGKPKSLEHRAKIAAAIKAKRALRPS